MNGFNSITTSINRIKYNTTIYISNFCSLKNNITINIKPDSNILTRFIERINQITGISVHDTINTPISHIIKININIRINSIYPIIFTNKNNMNQSILISNINRSWISSIIQEIRIRNIIRCSIIHINSRSGTCNISNENRIIYTTTTIIISKTNSTTRSRSRIINKTTINNT